MLKSVKITIALGLPLWLCAWDSFTLQRPVIGYALQQSPLELRPLLGVPGAAVFGNPLALPSKIARLRLAPGQQYAIIERAENLPAALILNGTELGGIVPIPGAVRGLDFVSFSPSGRSAVLVSQSSGRLQVFTGLPETPHLLQEIDLGMLPDLPANAGISDNAGSVLLSSRGAVYLLLPDNSTSIVLSVTQPASIAFLPASTTSAIGDPGTGSLYIFQRPAPGIVARLLTSGLPSLGQIAASGDGQILYVTDTQGQRIWSVNVASGSLRQFDLQVKASTLDRLRNVDMFLVSSESRLPAWIFYRQGEDARAVFVPATTSARLIERVPTDVIASTATANATPVNPNSRPSNEILTVNALDSPAIITPALPDGMVNAAYMTTSLQAQGGIAPYTWTAIGLPAGLSLNSPGVLSGTPTAAGMFNVTVKVIDSSTPQQMASKTYTLSVGLTAAPAFTLAVSAQPASITDQPRLTLTLSQSYPLPLQAVLTLSFTPNAAGLPSRAICRTVVTPARHSSFHLAVYPQPSRYRRIPQLRRYQAFKWETWLEQLPLPWQACWHLATRACSSLARCPLLPLQYPVWPLSSHRGLCKSRT